MSGRGLRESIQVEWFTVTYRSVGAALALSAVLAAGAGAAWYWFARYVPRISAEEAIDRAERRLGEASSVATDEKLEELVANARVVLEEAREEYSSGDYRPAHVSALRSENLSTQALDLARGDADGPDLVRFYRIEGDVRVKRAGEFSWDAARAKMSLGVGDHVKTSSTASAQLIYFDGTVTTIQPGSLLEIRDLYEDPVTQVRRVKEKLNWGELRASTQRRNVSGSFHEVTTDTVAARAEDAGEFRLAYDRNSKTSHVDVFDGTVRVAGRSASESLAGGERIRAGADGRLSAKETLPGVPRALAPSDQRVFVFEDPAQAQITLAWEPVRDAGRYELVISDGVLFTNRLYAAQRDDTKAVIDGVAPGSYFWKVAAVSPGGVIGPSSPPRRFRVSSQHIKDRSDTQPPALEITDFVAIGSMVVVNGRTEPGATLWVDNEKVDLDDNGTFYAVVRLRREGVNELKLVAQDAAGNETQVVRSALYQPY